MIERHQNILKAISDGRLATVSELSRMFNVSEVTIRADLTQLAKDGKLVRVHGGARILEERVKQEYTFQTRKSLNTKQKYKIGKAAAKLVQPIESIFLDSSTTSVAVAHALRNNELLNDNTVVTSGIWTAMELMSCQNINVLLTGGYIRNITGSITGQPAQEIIKTINIKKAFLGAASVSVEDGMCDTHLLEVELKRFVVERAKEVIIVVDGSKFNQSALASYATAKQVSKLITDDSAPQDVLEQFKSQGVEVIIANK